jgi:hypothetical protein
MAGVVPGIGDGLVDSGSPVATGVMLHADGSASDDTSGFRSNGACRPKQKRVLDRLRNQPLLALGGEYAIEVFELLMQ